jgi:hypothetical protein
MKQLPLTKKQFLRSQFQNVVTDEISAIKIIFFILQLHLHVMVHIRVFLLQIVRYVWNFTLADAYVVVRSLFVLGVVAQIGLICTIFVH